MTKKQMSVVLVRSPQPYLLADDGSLHSPNRFQTPEPTLPLLHGILEDAGQRSGLEMKVTQLDLRDYRQGKLTHNHYGDLQLPYLGFPLRKMVSGKSIESSFDSMEEADAVGFTNNFAMSRNVVLDNIRKVRQKFPDKEIWLGGRDIFPEDNPITGLDEVTNLYVRAAGGKNVVVFDGHVFSSLPEYIKFKAGKEANLHGVITFDKNGTKIVAPNIPLTKLAKEHHEFSAPLPIYPDPDLLELFNGSGEGPINDGRGRFAYMTISIGCPHDCGYCTTGFRERYTVRRTMKDIERELQLYKKLGVKTLGIMDDNILVMPPETVNDIMGLVNSFGFNIEYGNGLELKSLLRNWDKIHESVLKNCTTLYAPLENLSKDSFYRKLNPWVENIELLTRVRNYFDQIGGERYVTMGVILGIPGDTRKGLEEILPKNVERFLEVFEGSNVVRTAVTPFIFMPLFKTPFGKVALNSGGMVIDTIVDHPEGIQFEGVTYGPAGMGTPVEAAKIVYDAYCRTMNMNPAGRLGPDGTYLGGTYEELKRWGGKAPSLKGRVPLQWSELGGDLTDGRVAGAGLHYKAPMTKEIAEQNRRLLAA